MQENPGPKTIAELAQAAVDGQWLDKGDVRRVVETTVPRLRETFVRAPDGTFQRYQIKKDAAAALQNRTTVKMEVSRGAMGFDLITRFDPEK